MGVIAGRESALKTTPELVRLTADIRSPGTRVYVSGLADKARIPSSLIRVKTFDGLDGDRWQISLETLPVFGRDSSATSIISISWLRVRGRSVTEGKDPEATDLGATRDNSTGWLEFCAIKSGKDAKLVLSGSIDL